MSKTYYKIYKDASGNVGIGTTSPSNPLTVVGAESVSIDDYIVHNGDSDTKFGFPVNDTFKIRTAGTDRLYINSDGNVGIGTTSPTAQLEISSSSASNLLNVKGTGGDNILYVSGSGNVGIGTTSPAYTLDVASTTRIVGNLHMGISSSVPTPSFITLYGDGSSNHSISSRNINWATADDIRINTYGSLFINLDSNNNNTNTADFMIGRHGGSSTISDWLLKLDGESGNLGIGTTSPSAQLEISSSSAPSLLNVKGAGGNALLFVSGSGNVGIGTTSPSYKLDVVGAHNSVIASFGDGTDGIQFATRNTDRQQIDFLGSNTSTINAKGSLWINYDSDNNGTLDGILFGRNGTDENSTTDMIIVEGKVGIGTTTPSAQIEISSSSAPSLLNVKGVGGNGLLYVSGSGNIGIGTTGPDATLDVLRGTATGGTAQFRGTTNTSHFNYGTDEHTYIRGGKNGSYVTINNNHNGDVHLANGGGKVGIGTTSPSAQLEISSSSASNLLNLKGAGGNGLLYVSGSGHVGINTISPTHGVTLGDISSAVATGRELVFYRQSSDISTGYDSTLAIYSKTNSFGTYEGAHFRARGFKFQKHDGSIEYLTINQDGNVGISTASPSTKLHVNGLTTLGAAGKTEGGAVVNYASFGEVKSGAQTLLGNAVVPGTTNNTIQHSKSDAGNFMRMVYSKGISFHTNITDTVNTDVDIETNERVRIDLDGNVGIGITNPTEKLTVSGNTLLDGNLTVTGNSLLLSASYINITSSNVNIGDNIITLNAYSPFKQYAGLEMHDSGSSALAQFLWDSENNYFFVSGSTATNSQNQILLGPDGKADLTAGALPVSYNTNELSSSVVYQKGENVGIGITNPTEMLHLFTNVAKDVVLRMDSNSTGNTFIELDRQTSSGTAAIKFEDASTDVWGIGTYGADRLDFKENSLTASLSIVPGGNVGINTTSPSTLFTLHQASDTSTGGLRIQNSDNSSAFRVWKQPGGGASVLVDNGVDTLFLKNSSVGIGTSSPTAQLEISSSSASSLLNVKGAGGTGLLFVSGSGNVGIGTVSPDLQLHVKSSSGNSNLLLQRESFTSWQISAGSTYLTFLQYGGSELLRIQNTGKVGIGTTSPNVKLEIHGSDITPSADTTAESVLRLVRDIVDPNATLRKDSAVDFMLSRQQAVANNLPYTRLDIRLAGITDSSTPSVDVMSLLYDGNVGIGTTSPTEKLEVAGNIIAKDSGVLAGVDGDKDGFIFHDFATGGGNYWGYKGFTSPSRLSIVTDGSERLTVISDGKVGIGTTSPSVQLEISSSSASSLLNVKGTGGTGLLYVSGSGHVGIGTTSPSSRLNIISDISSESVFKAEGTSGTLFEVTDDLSNSLMSVNTIAGLPVFEVFSDYHIVGGRYNQNDFYLDTNGNLGLGTSSPNQKLEVFGNQRISNSGVLEFFGGTVYPQISRDGVSGGLIIDTAGGGVSNSVPLLSIRENGGTDFVTVLGSGNVGIGTTSPSQLLNIVRSDASGSAEFDLYSTNSAKQPMLTFRKSASNTIGTKSVTPSGGELGEIEFIGVNTGNNFASKSASIIGLQDGAAGATYIPGALTFGTGTNSAAISERMRIDSSGNVGIGTASPTAQLEISSSSASSLLNVKGADGTGLLFVSGSGYVGIGTTSPTSLLHIDTGANSAANFRLGANRTVANAAVGQLIGDWNGTAVAKIAFKTGDDTTNKDDGEIAFEVAAAGTTAEAMRIQSDGQIKFNNYGSSTFSGTATQRLAVDSNGNVIEIPIGAGAVDGSGTAGTMTKWSDSDTITDSSFLTEASTTLTNTATVTDITTTNAELRLPNYGRIGIGTNSTNSPLKVRVGDNATFNNGNAAIFAINDGNRGSKGHSSGSDLLRLEFSSSMGLLFNKDGELGIGTDNPIGSLHIYESGGSLNYLEADPSTEDAYIGNIYGRWSGSNIGLISFRSGADTANKDSGDIAFYTSTTGGSMIRAMTIDENQNIGIGTSNPGELLHVQNSNTGRTGIAIDNTSTNGRTYILGSTGTVGSGADPGSFIIRDGDASSNRFVINNSGSVGIGTNSPVFGLDNNSLSLRTTSATAEKDFYINFANGTANQKVDISFPYYNGSVFWGYLEVTITAGYSNQLSTGKITKLFSVGLNAPGGSPGSYTSQIYDDTNYYTSVYGSISDQWGIEGINFDTTTGQYYITIAHRVSTGNAIRVKVKGFGIQTGYFTDYQFGGLSAGSVYTTDTTVFSAPVITVPKLNVETTGTFGDDLLIGPTATPNIVLQSSGNGVNTNGKIYWKDSGGTVRASLGYETGGTEFFIDNTFSGGTYLKSNGTIGLTVNSAANVGVGTTSPSAQLEISSSSAPSLLNVKGDGGNALLFVSGSGNVGMGTSSPSSILQVDNNNRGNYFGGKTVSINNTAFSDILSIELPDHRAAYVKIFMNGDWSSHSSIAYVGEFMIQNGANSYNEPGTIISEFDNTFNGNVITQILDSTNDTFKIQAKLSTTGNVSNINLTYHIMGSITSIT